MAQTRSMPEKQPAAPTPAVDPVDLIAAAARLADESDPGGEGPAAGPVSVRQTDLPLPDLQEIRAANAGVRDGRFLLIALCRPLGPHLAWAALRLRLTPRQVNYFSLGFVIALLGVIAAGGRTGMLVGTSMVFVWQAIDVTDGTMARAMKIRDNFGGFVDYATGMLVAAFLPLCLGIGAWVSPDGSLAPVLAKLGHPGMPTGVAALMAGGAISSLSLILRLYNRVLLLRFGAALEGTRVAAKAEGMPATPWWRSLVGNLESIGGAQAIVFFVAVALSQLELTLALYAGFYFGLAVLFAVSTYRGFRYRTGYLKD